MGDDDTPIFEIRESNLDSGLRGIPVGTCQTSFVDPIEGVHYVGYPVEDRSRWYGWGIGRGFGVFGC